MTQGAFGPDQIPGCLRPLQVRNSQRGNSLLRCSQVNESLLLTALTTRSIEVMGGERITTRLSPAAAAEARDSLAKNLYARLFDWIVAAVNRKISALGIISAPLFPILLDVPCQSYMPLQRYDSASTAVPVCNRNF